MNDIDTTLSAGEKRAILASASEAYEKLRWEVGDSETMKKELVLLARDSYCAGRASAMQPTKNGGGNAVPTATPD